MDSLSEGDYDEESAWADWYASQGYDQVYYNYETQGYVETADGNYVNPNQAIETAEAPMQYNDYTDNVQFEQSEPLLHNEGPEEVINDAPIEEQEAERPMSVMSDQSDISIDDEQDNDSREGSDNNDDDTEEEEEEEEESEEDGKNGSDNDDDSDDSDSDEEESDDNGNEVDDDDDEDDDDDDDDDEDDEEEEDSDSDDDSD